MLAGFRSKENVMRLSFLALLLLVAVPAWAGKTTTLYGPDGRIVGKLRDNGITLKFGMLPADTKAGRGRISTGLGRCIPGMATFLAEAGQPAMMTGRSETARRNSPRKTWSRTAAGDLRRGPFLKPWPGRSGLFYESINSQNKFLESLNYES